MSIKTLVLKVASRCNLNCSYCYMYNLGDTTYKNQPKVMSKKNVDHVIDAVERYTSDHKVPSFQFILHGGEPLLAPLSWYEYFVKTCHERMPNVKLNFSLQSNGVLYDREWAEGLKRIGIHIGFSWDGPKKIHDKFRKYHNGKGSYEEVIKGMKIHKEVNGQVGGLSVINAEIPAKEYYENVKEIGMTNFSLLLPQLHYSMKEEYKKFKYSQEELTYGKWLCDLFDLWWDDPSPSKPDIQYFTDFLSLIMGEKRSHESFGDEENNVLVIETNGEVEASTSLKSCGHGFTKEGNHISTITLDEALDSDLIKLFVKSHKNLPKVCTTCDIKHICGGGRIAERYSEENGFDNPTVYCDDIKLIISHIQNRMLEDFAIDELKEMNIKKLKYEEL